MGGAAGTDGGRYRRVAGGAGGAEVAKWVIMEFSSVMFTALGQNIIMITQLANL